MTTYINGVKDIVRLDASLLYSPEWAKKTTIYIVGERHGMYGCENYKIKNRSIDILTFYKKLFSETEKKIDFFLETFPYEKSPNVTNQSAHLTLLREEIKDCVETTNCKYGNLIVHWVDTRQVSSQNKYWYPRENIMFEVIKNITDGGEAYDKFFEDNKEYLEQLYSASEKALRIVNNRNSSRSKKLIDDIFEDFVLSHPAILDVINNSINSDYLFRRVLNPIVNRLKRYSFRYNLGYKWMTSSKLLEENKYIILKAGLMVLSINMHPMVMDVYTILSVVDVSLKKLPSSSNILIHAGAYHTDIYRDVFRNIYSYKISESSHPGEYMNDYCVNISSISYPWFEYKSQIVPFIIDIAKIIVIVIFMIIIVEYFLCCIKAKSYPENTRPFLLDYLYYYITRYEMGNKVKTLGHG